MDELFAVYKPKGPTSHDIIMRIRRITGERHVGHAGTLDPLASGVLVVGVGRAATRKLTSEIRKDKTYIADIYLGASSATDDAEGERTTHAVAHIPTDETILVVLQKFVGRILQRPPVYSALKISGKPAYKRVREGERVELAPPEGEIHANKMLAYDSQHLKIQVDTGSGVYIRALARDIGEALGTGAYLADLERTRVGEFGVEGAVRLADLVKHLKM